MKNKLLLGVVLFAGTSISLAQQQAKNLSKDITTKPSKPTLVSEAKALGEVVWHDNFNTVVYGPGLSSTGASTWTMDNSGQTNPGFGWSTDAAYNGWWLTGAGAGVFASTSGGNFAELSNGTQTPTQSSAGNPALGVTYTLTSGVIDVQTLAGSGNAILSFEQDGATFNDVHEVQISTNGNTWTTIYDNGDKEGQTRFGSQSAADYIEVDITDYIAASPATVQIRFRWTTGFPNEGTNPWAWVTYGWLIDDVKISTKPDYDLVSTYSFHHTESYQYSQIPLTQVAPIVFRAGVKNQGSQSLTNVMLNLDVNSGAATAQSAAITLGANQVDTLEATYTPAALGAYTVAQSLTMTETDDKPGNNAIPNAQFTVTDFIYAVDKGAPFAQFPLTSLSVGGTPVIVQGIGNSFDIVADQEIYGIDFRFYTGTAINGEVYGQLYEYDTQASSIDQVWLGPLAETDMFTVTSLAQVNAIQTLPFIGGYTLEAGKTYLMLIQISGGTVELATGGTTTTSQAWIRTNHSNVWGTFTQIPVVRANFNLSLGVDNNEVLNGVSVFPNPATDKATVEFNLANASNVSVEVMDITGKVVETVSLSNVAAGANTADLNTAGYASGMYSVVIKSNDASVTRKLVVR
ncbi:MAG: T9SS type A sorting domain-containing protein [Crocinitomicaceae bacterium]|nr:T9SS type A sorting domain-containing protein [Crocinitomicaceae bacterium]